jgi:hypothetical protein
VIHAAVRPRFQDFSRLLEIVIEEAVDRFLPLHDCRVQVHIGDSEATDALISSIAYEKKNKNST